MFDILFYFFQMYQRAGARVQEDIREASVIMGVKQVPIDQLLPDRTYAFFAHVIKGQEANMPLLDAMLEMVAISPTFTLSIFTKQMKIYETSNENELKMLT